jgi:hypothetical protein
MAINVAGQTPVPANQIFSDGWAKYAQGSITFDATAIVAADYVTINIGFTPKYIRWENVTDRILNEWYDGMAAESAVNTIAVGTRTLSVTGSNKGFIVGNGLLTSSAAGPIPGPGQVQVSQNATLGAILASKVIRWSAFG